VVELVGVNGTVAPLSAVDDGNAGMYTAGTCAAGFRSFYAGPRLVYYVFLGFAVPLGGMLTVSTCGRTANDTVLYVGTGCPRWNDVFGCVVGSDDAGAGCASNGGASAVSLTAAQRTYYVQVGGVNGAPVVSGLAWSYAPPRATRSGSPTPPPSRSRSASRSRSRSRSRTRKGK